MVAKARAPVTKVTAAPSKPPKSSKKSAASKSKPALPASVTMATDRVLRGETLPAPLEMTGAFCGVLYKLVVSDANGRPIVPGAYRIRKHLLHVASSGCLAHEEEGARIAIVALDPDGASYDFAGVPAADPSQRSGETKAKGDAKSDAKGDAKSGKDEVFEYFSFELEGVSYAIPQSGFVLARSQKGRRIMITRTPQAGGSIHGAVVQGFVTEGGGDAYAVELV